MVTDGGTYSFDRLAHQVGTAEQLALRVELFLAHRSADDLLLGLVGSAKVGRDQQLCTIALNQDFGTRGVNRRPQHGYQENYPKDRAGYFNDDQVSANRQLQPVVEISASHRFTSPVLTGLECWPLGKAPLASGDEGNDRPSYPCWR